MVKKALLIGCNYPGTDAELDGCVNDVKRMRRCLLKLLGFGDEDVKLLIDTDESYTQPTGANIRRCINRLVRGAKPGDILFIHYSGHGMRVPAVSDDDDDTGYDECIVPCDMNLITDDDFREFVDKVPDGCSLTIVADSCHSGGLIDKAKEQIGDSYKREDEEGDGDKLEPPHRHRRQHQQPPGAEEVDDGSGGGDDDSEDANVKNRSLPVSTLIDILRQRTGREDVGVGKIRATLLDMFGEDASPKFKKLVEVMSKLRHGGGGGHDAGRGGGLRSTAASAVRKFLQQKLGGTRGVHRSKGVRYSGANHGDREVAHSGASRRSRSDNGILISGCQTDQTSANASATGRASGAYGALSNAILAILGRTDGEISNRELVLRAGKTLARQGFPQRPGLYCSDRYVDAPFLG